MYATLIPTRRRRADAQARTQPTPQRRGYQQLRAPPLQASPFPIIWTSSKTDADLARRFAHNQVTVECFDNDRRRIPAPGVQPIRQTAHCPFTTPAPVTPHPNLDPAFIPAAHLTRIHSVSLHLHCAVVIPCQLPAVRAPSRTKLLHRGSARTSSAHLLDTSSQAV